MRNLRQQQDAEMLLFGRTGLEECLGIWHNKIKVPKGWAERVHNVTLEMQDNDNHGYEPMVRYLAFNIGLSLYRAGWSQTKILTVMNDELVMGSADEHTIEMTGNESVYAERFEHDPN